MKKTTCSLLLSCLFCFLGSGLLAQSDYSIGFSYRFFDESGVHSTPLRQSDYLGQANHGWGLTFMTPSLLPKGPLHVQLLMDYSRNVLFSQTSASQTLETKKNYSDLHAGIRLTTKLPGRLQLFTQGQAGFQFLRDKRIFFDDPHVTADGTVCPGVRLGSTVDYARNTFSMAAGAGVRWQLKTEESFVDFGMTYLWGQRELTEVSTIPRGSAYDTPAAQTVASDFFNQAQPNSVSAADTRTNTAYLSPQHFTIWVSYVVPLDITE